MKLNKIGKMIATIGLGIMLTACSSGDSGDRNGKVELTIATWANENESKRI